MEKYRPKISVIVPIYNQELYLDQFFDSLKAQTFRDYELICVDDGSTDSSLSICNNHTDENIIVFSTANGGVSKARNIGLRAARGEYVAFVDPDDLLEPEYLNSLFQQMDDETDIACCSYKVLETGIEEPFFKDDKVFSSLDSKEALFLQLMNQNYGDRKDVHTAIGVPWGKLFRKTFLIENYLYFKPELKRMQDNIFCMHAFYFARKIKYKNLPLYRYRITNISSYTTYASSVYSSVLNNRISFLNLTGLVGNKKIKRYLIKESIGFYFLGSHSLAVRSPSILLAKKDIKKYCKNTVFDFLRCNCFAKLRFGETMRLFLFKFRFHLIIAIIYRVVYKKEKSRSSQ